MIPELILFFLLAIVAVAAALGMLLSTNAVYAALFLILNLATVAVFYLLLGAPFIAMAQVTVYAGAIMVLFLFVIMLLGAERLGGRQVLTWQRPLAILLGVVLLLEGGYLIVTRAGTAAAPSAVAPTFGSPATVGEMLLLVAMIGAIVLTRRT
jgi:NADH-quinone oxidoreductase subunit J